jgi:hypothetical protein
MHIIDGSGNIIEGKPLTQEQVDLIAQLGGSTGEIYTCSDSYLTARSCHKIAIYLVTNFDMKRVAPLEAEVAEVS